MRKRTYRSSSLYVGDQNRRIFLRYAKPVGARVGLLRHYFPKGTDLSVQAQFCRLGAPAWRISRPSSASFGV
jgi:hypothetical protein